jgi:hypothetical protein
VIGFLLMTSPAQADTGGLSATLKKTTQATGLSAIGKHATKTVRRDETVRHATTVTHARPVIHKIASQLQRTRCRQKFVPAQRARRQRPQPTGYPRSRHMLAT